MAHSTKEVKGLRPTTDGEWEPHRREFTELYAVQNKPLKDVRKYFREEYQFDPSEKQWKNKIKKWNLGKYYKNDEANQIVAGGPLPSRIQLTNEDIEARERAARSLKRKRARDKQESQQTSTITSDSDATDDSQGALIKRQADFVPQAPFQITTLGEKLLFGVYNHLHEAFLQDLWEPHQSSVHNAGKQAARSLSSELAAGRSFHEKKNYTQASKQWQKAIDCFENPDLLNTWYHETPIRLLFELGRMVHSKHERVATLLLKNLKAYAEKLPKSDSRRALFSVISELDVHTLRDLHGKAASCQYNGLASLLDKRHQLLHDVKLNRALDALWFDPNADISEWMTEVADLDRDLGTDNPYSIYFMMLEAYRHVAQDQFKEADDTCREVGKRLDQVKRVSNTVDMFKVGLAYRRLGRQYHDKKRLTEARTTMATALKLLKNTKHGASVLVEICQLQETMAHELNDDMLAFIWKSMLENMMKQNEQEDNIKAMQLKRRWEPETEVFTGADNIKRQRIYEVDPAQEEQIMQQSPYELHQETSPISFQQSYPPTISTRQMSFGDTSSPLNEMSPFEGNFLSRTNSLLMDSPVAFSSQNPFEQPVESQTVQHVGYQQIPQMIPDSWAHTPPQARNIASTPYTMGWQNPQILQSMPMSNVRLHRPNVTIP